MKIVFALLWLMRLLPLPVIIGIAWIIASITYVLAHERRRVGLINLRICFPDMPRQQRKALILRNFHSMIQLALEYGIVWWSSASRIRRLVTIKNLHYVTDLREQGNNIILFYPHFVGLEICAYALNQHIPLFSVYSHQKNTQFDTQVYQGRQRFNNAYIVPRQAGLRSIIKAMRSSRAPLLYLPDQDFGARDSIFVPFFNTQAATITGLARLSKLAHAKVIPAIARRVGNRFELECYPPWENYPTDDIAADTCRMNTFLEERIREAPEQYFWLHKRFKTRPTGEAKFY